MNKELKRIATRKKWNLENKDKIAKQQKEYHLKNRDKVNRNKRDEYKVLKGHTAFLVDHSAILKAIVIKKNIHPEEVLEQIGEGYMMEYPHTRCWVEDSNLWMEGPKSAFADLGLFK